MRRILAAALSLVVPSVWLTAQSPATPAFEVASVKLDPKQNRGGPYQLDEISLPTVRVMPGGVVESYGHTLRNLIAVAYNVNLLYQKIEGKQDVLDMEFVISARTATPTLTATEAMPMLRSLLEERFQLKWRLQPRDIDGYLMVPAREDSRPGPGLRPFIGDDCEARAQNGVVIFDSPDYEQKARCNWSGQNARQRGVGMTTAAIAERLTMLMATPVSDRAAWPGRFTFDIIADTRDMPFYTAMRSANLGARLQSDEAPYLLDVLQRELGLKLVKDRVTVNDFVVERVEPLIEN